MKTLNTLGAGILATAIGAVLVAGSVTAATRLGVLPTIKRQQAIPKTAYVKETAFNRFIVRFPENRSTRAADVVAAISNAAASVGLYGLRAKADGTKTEFKVSYNRKLAVGGAHAVKLSHGITVAEAQALSQALKNAGARYAHPDYKVQLHAIPNDPQYATLQWDFNNPDTGINVENAWDATTGEGTVIAVLDTGYVDHADLAGNIVRGYDFIADTEVSRDGDGRDDDAHDMGDWGPLWWSTWHGTHVAGTIGAVTNNGIGIAGVAHGAKVQPVRVMGTHGGYWSDIADAVIWASGGIVPDVAVNATPATVINMSLGGYNPDGCEGTIFQDIFDAAMARGTTMVVSAGNSNWDAKYFTPANCPGVITVGASAVDGGRSYYYSNYGEYVTVSAPGGNGFYITEPNDHFIWSLGNTGLKDQDPSPAGDAVVAMEGTSMAAPHVAGIAALIQSAAIKRGGKPLSPAQVKTLIRWHARPWLINPTLDKYQGAGLANAAGAVWDAMLRPFPTDEALSVGLTNRFTVSRQYATARESLLYKIDVPAGKTSFTVRTYGGVGDVDLYASRGVAPTEKAYERKSARLGTTEQVTFAAPVAGTYYIRAYARKATGNLSVLAAY